jgi:hypothetical protein
MTDVATVTGGGAPSPKDRPHTSVMWGNVDASGGMWGKEDSKKTTLQPPPTNGGRQTDGLKTSKQCDFVDQDTKERCTSITDTELLDFDPRDSPISSSGDFFHDSETAKNFRVCPTHKNDPIVDTLRHSVKNFREFMGHSGTTKTTTHENLPTQSKRCTKTQNTYATIMKMICDNAGYLSEEERKAAQRASRKFLESSCELNIMNDKGNPQKMTVESFFQRFSKNQTHATDAFYTYVECLEEIAKTLSFLPDRITCQQFEAVAVNVRTHVAVAKSFATYMFLLSSSNGTGGGNLEEAHVALTEKKSESALASQGAAWAIRGAQGGQTWLCFLLTSSLIELGHIMTNAPMFVLLSVSTFYGVPRVERIKQLFQDLHVGLGNNGSTSFSQDTLGTPDARNSTPKQHPDNFTPMTKLLALRSSPDYQEFLEKGALKKEQTLPFSQTVVEGGGGGDGQDYGKIARILSGKAGSIGQTPPPGNKPRTVPEPPHTTNKQVVLDSTQVLAKLVSLEEENAKLKEKIEIKDNMNKAKRRLDVLMQNDSVFPECKYGDGSFLDKFDSDLANFASLLLTLNNNQMRLVCVPGGKGGFGKIPEECSELATWVVVLYYRLGESWLGPLFQNAISAIQTSREKAIKWLSKK